MTIRHENGQIFISGDLSQTEDLDSVLVIAGQQQLNFSELRSITSTGIRAWVNWLHTNQVIPIYHECPPPLVENINLIIEYTPGLPPPVDLTLIHSDGVALIPEYEPNEYLAFVQELESVS